MLAAFDGGDHSTPYRSAAFHRFTLKEANLTSGVVTIGADTPETGGAADIPMPTFCSKLAEAEMYIFSCNDKV